MAQGSNLTISPLWSPTGLVGYWPMDEGTGTTALDTSGSGNIGTWNGSTTNGSYYGSGKVGTYAGVFDGNTDYISTSVAASPVTYPAQTMIAWIYSTALPAGNRAIFSFDGVSGGFYRSISTTGSTFNIAVGNTEWTPGAIPVINTWEQVAVVYSNSNIYFYYNGVLYTYGSAGSFGASSSNLSIGRDNYSGGVQYFPGLIDDLRIYNRALSAAEIQALYNAQK